MKLNQETFLETYSRKETAELQALHSSGQLTPDAYDALEKVLNNRGIEPAARPTFSEVPEKESITGWGNFFSWFIIVFAISIIAHRIFLSEIPNPANSMPGSVKDMVSRVIGDSFEFILVFIILSIPIIAFSKLRGKLIKGALPNLLKVALVITLMIEALLIFGSWYAAQRMS